MVLLHTQNENAYTEHVAQRRFHYEQAFEHYLRANCIPYVAVDEAKKSLLPPGEPHRSLKSFDFVVYTGARNLLIDVKGRMYGSPARDGGTSPNATRRRFESWVTLDDIDSLKRWQELFGDAFQATFVFIYCLRQQPPDALFEQVFSYSGRWYALREAALADYVDVMQPRSKKWATVSVPADDFERISRPFAAGTATDAAAEGIR